MVTGFPAVFIAPTNHKGVYYPTTMTNMTSTGHSPSSTTMANGFLYLYVVSEPSTTFMKVLLSEQHGLYTNYYKIMFKISWLVL